MNNSITTLERLKIELNNRLYYNDATLSMYLNENDLNATNTYNKKTMHKKLLYTVYDILDSLSNNIDLFHSVETEFATTGDAYSELEKRLKFLKNRIDSIPNSQNNGESRGDTFTLFYTREDN